LDTLKIEHWDVKRLVPYSRNPRKNDPHVERMAKLIEEFGFRIPLVVKSDGTVVDGHLRLKAAARLKLPKVPVVLADELTDEQVKAFRLVANKSVEWSDWDISGLALEFSELENLGVDLLLTGFEPHEVSEIRSAADLELSGDDGEGISESRFGKAKVKIKVVLTGEYLDLFEKALDATHQMNRAEALKMICEAYLGTKEG
jgi:ParB-like chromosome segregation protein Spo0J